MGITVTHQQVMLFTGQVIHLVDRSAPPLPGVQRERYPSLCNIKPVWPGIWFEPAGTSPLPLCLNCSTKAGVDGSGRA